MYVEKSLFSVKLSRTILGIRSVVLTKKEFIIWFNIIKKEWYCMMNSIPGVDVKTIGQGSAGRLKRKLSLISKSLFLEKGGLLIIVGFLLGRAVVLSVVSPFAVAFLAT